VGTFTPEGTLDAAAGKLGYLADLGIDAQDVVVHGREVIAALRGLLSGHLHVGLVQPLPDRRGGRRYASVTAEDDERDERHEAGGRESGETRQATWTGWHGASL